MDWIRLEGETLVKVQAYDEAERRVQFEFRCQVGKNLCAYDKMDYIASAANSLALLRGYHRYKVLEVEKV